MPYQKINDDARLEAFCRELADAKCIGMDTEFVAEHTYRPQLCLVQVAYDGRLALIDPMTIKDMRPFWEALARPGHETIVHAGRGDVEFSLHAVGGPPAGLIDVQIAAGLAGFEYPAGYGSLIGRLLGVKSNKQETRTDWRRRPLTERQIEYALDDVRHLKPLRDVLVGKLESLGRRDWLTEEMESFERTIARAMSHEPWRRVSGNSGLSARSLAILRELWRWRDDEASRRDKPARRILRDDLLVEVARRKTADPKRVGAVRGMEYGDVRRHLPKLAECVLRGLELPEEECPGLPPREKGHQLSVLGQFLFAALGSVCRELDLAPGLVGTPNDIRALLAYQNREEGARSEEPPSLARGWRAQVVGNLFDDLLSGKKAVRIKDAASEYPLVFE